MQVLAPFVSGLESSGTKKWGQEWLLCRVFWRFFDGLAAALHFRDTLIDETRTPSANG